MDELIEQNMGLVIDAVNSFCPRNLTERQDLIDAGRIGLWKALQKYNKDKGVISTYVWRPIRWSIIRELKRKKYALSLSDYPQQSMPESGAGIWELFTTNMTDDEKQLIDLRCQGYKFREICELVNETPANVKNKFYKALEKIKEGNNE